MEGRKERKEVERAARSFIRREVREDGRKGRKGRREGLASFSHVLRFTFYVSRIMQYTIRIRRIPWNSD